MAAEATAKAEEARLAAALEAEEQAERERRAYEEAQEAKRVAEEKARVEAEIKAEAAAETKAAEAKEGGLWLRVRVHSSWGGVGEHKRVGLDSLSLVDGEGKQLPLPASSLLVFQGLTQVSSFNF